MFTRGQILSAQAAGSCLPRPSGLRIPRHLCRCLDCHHSDFSPPLCSPHVTVLPKSLLQYPILFPGALQNLTRHSCRSFFMEPFLNSPSSSGSLVIRVSRSRVSHMPGRLLAWHISTPAHSPPLGACSSVIAYWLPSVSAWPSVQGALYSDQLTLHSLGSVPLWFLCWAEVTKTWAGIP